MHRVLWILFNAVWFQVIWVSAVLGGNGAAIFLIGMLLMHVLLQSERLAEVAVISACGLSGAACDSLMAWLGLYVFPNGGDLWSIPVWLYLLWFGLAGTLRHSMFWLVKRPLISPIVGALAASLSYFVAQELGAVSFPYGEIETVLIVGLYWLGIFPLARVVIQRVDIQFGTSSGNPAPRLAIMHAREKS